MIMKGVIHVTGEHDTGKTTFALESGAQPERICFFDDDIKGRATIEDCQERWAEQGRHFGAYHDLAQLGRGKKVLEFHQACLDIINSIEPGLTEMLEARENYNLFRPFLPPNQGGNRLQHLTILYEITRLFPDPNDAYLTELTIFNRDKGGLATSYDIVTVGKVRQGDTLTEFIDRLNRSELFQESKRAGSLTQEPGDSLYPFSFSVACNLRRPTAGTAKP